MIKVSISSAEQDTVFERLKSENNSNLRMRLLALHLKGLGLSHELIGQVCRLSRPTLATYLKDWKQGGLDQLMTLNFYQPVSDLKAHEQELKAYFELHPPQNSNEARAKIKEITGIERSPTQVRAFMSSIGMRLRKVGFIPAKANTQNKQQEQEDFKKNAGTFVGTGKRRQA